VEEVGIEKIPSLSENAVDFSKESIWIGIVMRGFDIHNGIEGHVWERKAFGVSDCESNGCIAVRLTSSRDVAFRKVEANNTSRTEMSANKLTTSTLSASHLQDFAVRKIHLPCDMQVELHSKEVTFPIFLGRSKDEGFVFQPKVQPRFRNGEWDVTVVDEGRRNVKRFAGTRMVFVYAQDV
jgi:hypothetical protein